MPSLPAAAGDILAVWTGQDLADDMIRVGEALEDLSALVDPLWRWPSEHHLLPGHVVCSSLAAMLYDLPSVGWPHPDLGHERECEPADWWQWSQSQAWTARSQAFSQAVS
jgi:hypothetical protein